MCVHERESATGRARSTVGIVKEIHFRMQLNGLEKQLANMSNSKRPSIYHNKLVSPSLGTKVYHPRSNQNKSTSAILRSINKQR